MTLAKHAPSPFDSAPGKHCRREAKAPKSADLPVEMPMKFEFAINLKAAKQISLTIPPEVLARADRVIR